MQKSFKAEASRDHQQTENRVQYDMGSSLN